MKKFLSDVAIIRPILIILLVFYHAFAIYSGKWKPLEGFPEIEAYWWLDELSFAYMLEMFVFLSGYIYGYQVFRGGQTSLSKLVTGKLKRLIVPSIVFSIVYEILLISPSPTMPVLLYNILNGVGHMWFLPMLFWCFVMTWLIDRMKLSPKLAMFLLIVMAFASAIPFPLRIGNALYYMPFFYGAYLIKKNNVELARFYTRRNAIITTSAFITSFVLLTVLGEYIDQLDFSVIGSYPMIVKMVKIEIHTLSMLIYSSIGIMMLMTIVGLRLNDEKQQPPVWLINLGNLCMGVYLFQQFILKGMYNHTLLPVVLGPYILPWVCFVVTLCLSLVLAYMFRLTRVGRLLIG